MFGQPINWRHIAILAISYSRYAIRGGSGLVYLLIFLFVGLTIGGVFIDQIKRIHRNLEREGVKMEKDEFVKWLAKQVRPTIANFIGVDEGSLSERPQRRGGPVPAPDNNKPKEAKPDPFVEYLVVENPPVLSAFLMVMFWFTPFTVCLGAFNQLSGDIGTKGLRYLLLRTERINIILARFLGTLLFTSTITLFMVLVVITYMYFAFRSDSFPALLAWGFRGWLALLIFGLPYVCLCTWMSAAFDTPFVTLVLCYLLIGLPIFLLKMVTLMPMGQMNLDWLERLTPWGWKYELLHPDLSTTLLAVGVNLAFALVFFFVAVWHFLRRDL